MRILFFISIQLLTGCTFAQNWLRIENKDPYYKPTMYNIHNPKQLDFSSNFYNYISSDTEIQKHIAFSSNEIREQEYVFDGNSLFCTQDSQQNGILGFDCRRIRVHISEATRKRTGYVLSFYLKGKTNTLGNVCDFEGTVMIEGIYKFKDGEYGDEGIMKGTYELKENKNQK